MIGLENVNIRQMCISNSFEVCTYTDNSVRHLYNYNVADAVMVARDPREGLMI